jgi:hypothetical protein
MAENISTTGEISFFGERDFHYDTTKNNKDISKNSSNPERTYEKLNLEIKNVTDNKKDLSYLSNSNSKINDQPECSDQFLNIKYWKNKENSRNQTQSPKQFSIKFEKIKKLELKKNKNKIPKPNNSSSIFEYTSDIDEFYSDELNENNEDHEIINKISSINIQSPNFQNSINNTSNNKSLENENQNIRFKSITEPDEYTFQRPSVIENFNNNSTPRKVNESFYTNPYINYPLGSFFSMNNYGHINKGSFASTNYSSNKVYHNNYGSSEDIIEFDDSLNENVDCNSIGNGNYKSYLSNYRAKIPNNESNDSIQTNNNIRYPIMNLNLVYCNPNNNNLIENINNNNNSNQPFFTFQNNMFFTPNNNVQITKNNNYYNRNENQINNKGEKQFINLENVSNGKDTRTTVMIRNIPIKYSDKMLLKELEEFNGKFDCVYMPYDFEKGGNKGYAFINLIHPFHILLFHEKFQNKSWTYFESKKICELNCANFQGKSDIQKHAKNYKGLKKPIFFNETDIANIPIEVPLKYLKKVKERFPKMSYVEKKNQDIFIIKSFED